MVLEEHRPTPEEILKKIRMIDPDETRVRQGRLKILFGYAAGVGKTYAMLEMAHQMKDMGVDVVAGYIEPHIRPATMKLVEGLECLPPLVVSYKGITLREFNEKIFSAADSVMIGLMTRQNRSAESRA